MTIVKKSIKYGLTIYGIVLLSNKMLSQDTINFKNGEKKIALISEISSDEIKYKNYFHQDGPDYKSNKSEISSISYKNGLKEQFSETKITNFKKGSHAIDEQERGIDLTKNNKYMSGGNIISTYEAWRQMGLKRDKKIDLHITKARNANAMKHAFGWSTIPLGGAAILFYEASVPETQYNYNGGVGTATTVTTDAHRRNRAVAIGLGILSAASISTSIYMNFEKKNETEKARKLYNKTYFNY